MSETEKALNQLLSMKGMSEAKSVVQEWETIARNNASERPARVFLPDYLCVAPPGAGVSTLIGLLAERLDELKLMPFSNARKHLEFMLEYEPDDKKFTAFKRYYNLVEHGLSQYGEPFAGIIAIDITEWVKKIACKDLRFLRFLEYVAQKDEMQMIVFLTTCTTEGLVKEAESVIIQYLRLRRITLKTVDPVDFTAKLADELASYGLSLDPDANAELVKTIELAAKERGFGGLKTITQLAKDIVYEKYCSPRFSPVIGLQDISRFTVNGAWLRQLKAHFRLNPDD